MVATWSPRSSVLPPSGSTRDALPGGVGATASNPASVSAVFNGTIITVPGLVAGNPEDYVVQPDAKLLALVPEEPLTESGFVLGAYSTAPGRSRLGFVSQREGLVYLATNRTPV